MDSPNIPESLTSHNQDNDAQQPFQTQVPTIGNPTPSSPDAATHTEHIAQVLHDDNPGDGWVRRRLAAFAIRPQGLKEYQGKSIAECREFVRKCGITFRIDPDVFQGDFWKILYAEQFLRGSTAELWNTETQELGEAKPTWNNFCDFLLNLVQDPENRARETAMNYENAIQKPNQTVVEFVNYLDRLEAHLRGTQVSTLAG